MIPKIFIKFKDFQEIQVKSVFCKSASLCHFPSLCGVGTACVLLPFYPISRQVVIHSFHTHFFFHAIHPSLLQSTLSSLHTHILIILFVTWSSLRITWPHQAMLLLLIFSVIGVTFTSSISYSFGKSNRDTENRNRIHIAPSTYYYNS